MELADGRHICNPFVFKLFTSCSSSGSEEAEQGEDVLQKFEDNLYTEHSFRLFAHFYKSVVKYLQVNEAITLKEPFRKHFG